MKTIEYLNQFKDFILSEAYARSFEDSIKMINQSKRLFFIGNGGSNAICSHMSEDYQKILGYPSLCFSDGALITCFANDYGYENAIMEWLKSHCQDGDLLIAISSSGESKNILNAVNFFNEKNNNIITLSGFKEGNSLSKIGKINIHTNTYSYGITECLHEVILHSILDQIVENNTKI